MSNAIRIFYSYARQDKRLRDRLSIHLAPLRMDGLIEEFHDRMILPGDRWEEQIAEELEQSNLILLLVSADFLASEYIQSVELEQAFDQERDGRSRVVPIILRDCEWQRPPLRELEALSGDKPVTDWRNREKAWSNVRRGIELIVNELRDAEVSESRPDRIDEDPDETDAATAPPVQQGTIVFYAPTIRANTFFAEQLDHATQKVLEKGYRLEIRKGNLDEYHNADNMKDVIKDYAGRERTVLIMIPPTPDDYEHVWKLDNNVAVNLITLDMGVPENEKHQLAASDHLKAVILVDNEKGADLAAEEVVAECVGRGLEDINVIVCEGHIHRRGELFSAALARRASEASIELMTIGRHDALDFSRAFRHAEGRVRGTFTNFPAELLARPTFIFCANDNMAMGARLAITNFRPADLGMTAEELDTVQDRTRIVGFDASTFVRLHIENRDRFLWRAIDQNHTSMVSTAVDLAEDILDGRSGPRDKEIRITPTLVGSP